VALTGVIARYADAWNDHDAAACAACFIPEGRRIWCVRGVAPTLGPPAPPRFDGHEAIAAAIAGFMACVPDLQLDVDALSEGSDERIWTEWRLTGTHVADWGRWDAKGEAVDLVGVSIFRVAPGGIREERVYWDSLVTAGSPAAASLS
jgi:hypothetical protein